MVYVNFIPNDSSAQGHVPFLVWDGVRANNGELWPKDRCESTVFDVAL